MSTRPLPPGPARSAATAPPPSTVLLDALAHGVVVHRDFELLYANRAMARRLGFASVEALLADRSLLRFVPSERHAEAERRHARVMAGLEPPAAALALPHVTATGASFWAEIDEAVIDWQGAPAVMASLVDVTEEIETRTQQHFLKEAIDYLSDSFILYGPDDRVLLTNQRFHEVFDYLPPQGEIVGRSMMDLVHASLAAGVVTDPNLGEDVAGWVERYIANRRVQLLQLYEDTWPSGRWDLVKEQRLSSGAFISVRTDITDRKRAEFALKDQEARLESALAERTAHLQAILANIAQGVTVTDPELRIVLANRGFLDMFGFPDWLAVPGTSVADYVRYRLQQGRYRPWEDRGADIETLVERRLASYRTLTQERYQEPLPDGGVVEVHRQRLPDGSVVSTYTNITERIRAEEELARQREALYQSEKLSALGVLLAGVAHELNNPLSVVLGHASLLETLAEGAKDRERAAKIRAAAERCARIVKTFLAMARGEPASHAALAIDELVGKALELVEYQLRTSGVEVVLTIAPGLPPIDGDADQLTQVLVNLVINAKQAMLTVEPPRRLTIEARHDPAADAVLLAIADTGPGVPEPLRRRIFEPFFTTKPVGAGTGVGLAVSHGMVAAHGGTITVGDAPGGGACFTLRLPSRPLQPKGAPAVSDAAAPARGRVLVVDDEADIRAFLRDLLAAEGLAVRTAASGREALGLLAEERFDAILCDLRMPEMDGPSFHAELAQRQPALLGRIIFTTGDVLSEASQAFLQTLPGPYLEKPFMPGQVRRLVAALLARDRPAPAGPAAPRLR
jgi:PAS domain S-box-containing protein